MSGVDISNLKSLGTIDAETDFRPDFFIPSTSWANIRSRERPIVVGRKGTGKTALRYALRNEASENPLLFSRDLAFRDYPWAVHYGVYDSTVGGRSRYQETWSFLILVELAKLVVGEDQSPQDSTDDEDVAHAIRKFLTDTWGGVTFDHRDTFRRDRFRVTRASVSPTIVGSSLGSVDWTTVERTTLGDALSAMNRWLRAALARTAHKDAEYFVVFDELDLDFESNDENYQDSMIGLVLAAQSVFLWAKGEGLPIAPVVLLRDDIYGSLNFPDKNKITTNLVESLYWTADFDGSNSLKSVIDRRIGVTLGAPDPDPWYLVFDEEVMRGTQHKFLHMAQRTYLRPRDIINFANECLSIARTRGAIIDGERVANQDVTAARIPYSNYLRRELNDEIHAHYPDWEGWLELLRRVGKITFSRADFDAEAERAPTLAIGLEPLSILTALYAFGVIGFGRRGGAGRGGTNEYWSYRNPEITFDPDAPFFKVHLGLKENLDLKEGR
jgi:hypothetical protein